MNGFGNALFLIYSRYQRLDGAQKGESSNITINAVVCNNFGTVS